MQLGSAADMLRVQSQSEEEEEKKEEVSRSSARDTGIYVVRFRCYLNRSTSGRYDFASPVCLSFCLFVGRSPDLAVGPSVRSLVAPQDGVFFP